MDIKKQAATPSPSLEGNFPDLHLWFDFLNGGYQAGATWRSLLEGHVQQIGRRRARALALELDRLLHLIDRGLLGDDDVAITACGLLGLDPAVPASEHLSPGQLLSEVRSALANLV